MPVIDAAPAPIVPATPTPPHNPHQAYFLSRFGTLLVVLVPFLSVIAAAVLLWGAPWTWLYLALLIGGYLITGIGITVGYHRLFTHRAFRTGPVVKTILGILGLMAVEGPILRWAAVHRRHHHHTDEPGDPHSPHLHGAGLKAWLHGLYHSHFGWLFEPPPAEHDVQRYVPDLAADPIVRTLDRFFVPLALLGLAFPALIALAVTGTWTGALLGFVWGGLLRIFLVHHLTWSINSVCHIWGTRTFDTPDHSRDNLIFGILGLGEGWHNSHHAFPASARHGLRWWQFDLSYLIIRTLALARLAHDIRLPDPARLHAKRTRPAA